MLLKRKTDVIMEVGKTTSIFYYECIRDGTLPLQIGRGFT